MAGNVTCRVDREQTERSSLNIYISTLKYIEQFTTAYVLCTMCISVVYEYIGDSRFSQIKNKKSTVSYVHKYMYCILCSQNSACPLSSFHMLLFL